MGGHAASPCHILASRELDATAEQLRPLLSRLSPLPFARVFAAVCRSFRLRGREVIRLPAQEPPWQCAAWRLRSLSYLTFLCTVTELYLSAPAQSHLR